MECNCVRKISERLFRKYSKFWKQAVYSYKSTLENTEGQPKMDKPDKLATLGTQDEEKQNKNTT